MKLKELFKYRALWKHQKNRNKQLTKRINRLTKRINRLTKNVSEDLKIDVTNEEIRKLRLKANSLERRIIKLNLEAQKYFDMLMEKESDSNE